MTSFSEAYEQKLAPVYKKLGVDRTSLGSKGLRRAAFLDIETTGLSPTLDAMHEAAVAYYKPGGEVSVPSPIGTRGMYIKPVTAAGEVTPWESVNPWVKKSLIGRFEGRKDADALARQLYLKKVGQGVESKGAINQIYSLLNKRDLWVQNLQFESSFLEQFGDTRDFENFMLKNRVYNPYQVKGRGAKRLFTAAPEIDQLVSKAFVATGTEEILGAWSDVFTKGFEKELPRTREFTRVIDLMSLTRSVHAMAQQKGYMQATGDLSGTLKVNTFSRLMMGIPEPHTAIGDVRLESVMAEFYLNVGEAMSKGDELPTEVAKYFENVDKASNYLRQNTAKTQLLDAHSQLATEGTWIAKMNPKERQVPFYEAGTGKKLGMRSIYVSERKNLEAIEDVAEFLNNRRERNFGRLHGLDYKNILEDLKKDVFPKIRENVKQIDNSYIVGNAVTANDEARKAFRNEVEHQKSYFTAEGDSIIDNVNKLRKKNYIGELLTPKRLLVGGGILAGGALILGLLMGKDTDSDVANDISSEYAPISRSYKIMRASTLSHSIPEVYQSYTTGKTITNKLALASMETGTALHRVIQKRALAAGVAADVETPIYDEKTGITGHVDILYKSGVASDVKTLSDKRFQQAMYQGEPFREHRQQVGFYAHVLGQPYAAVEYVSATDPSKHLTYSWRDTGQEYEEMVSKAAVVRHMIHDSNMPVTQYTSPLYNKMKQGFDKFNDFILTSNDTALNAYKEKRKEYNAVRSGTLHDRIQRVQYSTNTRMQLLMQKENVVRHGQINNRAY